MPNFLKQLLIFVFAGLLTTGCLKDDEEPELQLHGDLVTVENPQAKNQFFYAPETIINCFGLKRDIRKTSNLMTDSGLLIYYNILSDKN